MAPNVQATGWRKPIVGIITALPEEYAAVEVLLENKVDVVVPGQGAGRRYTLGEFPALNGGRHQVALGLIGDMGHTRAAIRAALLLSHYPTVEVIVMVGIAAGMPHPSKADEHVRLGDIVVSSKYGIIQYDLIKQESTKTEFRFPPRPPSPILLETLSFLEVTERKGERPWQKHIERAMQALNVSRPPDSTDQFIFHPPGSERIDGQPRVFFGPIASANKLLKDAKERDRLREQFRVKAAEMEGAGVADAAWTLDHGYLVVRGISDYGDETKNDIWHGYAAIVAAAYTRSLFEATPAFEVTQPSAKLMAPDTKKLRKIIGRLYTQEKFELLCQDLQVYVHNIPGATLELKEANLIDMFNREGRLQELIEAVLEQYIHLKDLENELRMAGLLR